MEAISMVKKYFAQLIMIISSTSVLGGGFYAYGVFDNRIAQLENAEYVINQTVDLQPVYEKIDEVRDNLVLRQDGFVEKIDSAKDVLLQRQSEKVREINTEISTVKNDVSTMQTEISLNIKEIELLKLQVEEIELRDKNPFMN